MDIHLKQYFLVVSDSSDFGLLGEQSSPKWEIPCPGRRSTTVQNLTPLALSSPEKYVTVQTHKKQTKNSKRYIHTYLSACVDNNSSFLKFIFVGGPIQEEFDAAAIQTIQPFNIRVFRRQLQFQYVCLMPLYFKTYIFLEANQSFLHVLSNYVTYWNFCQTGQPVIPVWHVPELLQACSGTAATEEGQSRQLIARQLPAHLQHVDRVKDSGEAGVGASASSPAQLSKLQSVPVSIQNRTSDGNSRHGSPQHCPHCGRRQADLCVDRSRSVRQI